MPHGAGLKEAAYQPASLPRQDQKAKGMKGRSSSTRWKETSAGLPAFLFPTDGRP